MSRKRRTFTPEIKLQCVLDLLSGRKRPVQICREHNISDSLLARWGQQFTENAVKSFESEQKRNNIADQRIGELERLVGQLTLEAAASKKKRLLRLSVEKRRELVDLAKDEFDTRLLCKVLGLAHSSFYYTSTAKDDSWLGSRIERICLIHHRRGYRRVTDALHRQGIIVNRKRVQRLIQEMGLSVRPRRRHVTTTRSSKGEPPYPNLFTGLLVTRPDQVWCGDITFILPANGQTAYLALLMDVFTRMIRGWSLDMSMSVKLIDDALDKAILTGHQPKIHHSDQGGQYIARRYCNRLSEINCRISMADRGKAWQNPYVESVIGHLKDEFIYDEEFIDFQHAYGHLSHVLDMVYNTERSHSSLGYLTPLEFEAQYQRSQLGGGNEVFATLTH